MDNIPGIILVRPQMGENIGAAARAMLNFGLDHMRIVAPRDGWPNPAAKAMASGAGRVLDSALICDDVAEGLEDFHFTFATTARPRDLNKPVYSPEEAMRVAAEKIGTGQRVGVLFGPERAGLENEDLAQANAIITVPVNPEYPSLNLAQCVLLVGYEWRRLTTEVIGLEQVMASASIRGEMKRTMDANHLHLLNSIARVQANHVVPVTLINCVVEPAVISHPILALSCIGECCQGKPLLDTMRT